MTHHDDNKSVSFSDYFAAANSQFLYLHSRWWGRLLLRAVFAMIGNGYPAKYRAFVRLSKQSKPH